MHQGDTASAAGGICPRAMTEMGVCIANNRGAMRGPTGVSNTGGSFKVAGADLLSQFSHPGGTARPLQAVGVNRYAARVIPAVLQPGETLHQDRNDVPNRDRTNNATHRQLQIMSRVIVGQAQRNITS